MPFFSGARLWRMAPLAVFVMSLVALHMQWHQHVQPELLAALPYVFSAVLIAVAWMFNRSRFLLPALLVSTIYWCIQNSFQHGFTTAHYWQLQALLVFAGTGFAFCSVLPERGARHWQSVVLVVVGVLGIWSTQQGSLGIWLESLLAAYTPAMATPLSEARHWLSAGAIVVLGIGGLIGLLAWSWRRDAGTQAVLLCIAGCSYVAWQFALPQASSVVLSGVLAASLLLFMQNNYQVTYMDALTGIAGRRAMDDYLPTLGRQYAIAMLDVDHFKKFNDTHGHDVGDQVLKMVASQINRVEGGGKAFRYGGEEFAVVFPRRSAQDSVVFLEAVRESIAHYALVLRGEARSTDAKEGKSQRGSQKSAHEKALSVTISIGVASSAAGYSPQEIIKQADVALYAAKQNGRNQTVQSGREPTADKPARKSSARSKAKRAA